MCVRRPVMPFNRGGSVNTALSATAASGLSLVSGFGLPARTLVPSSSATDELLSSSLA